MTTRPVNCWRSMPMQLSRHDRRRPHVLRGIQWNLSAAHRGGGRLLVQRARGRVRLVCGGTLPKRWRINVTKSAFSRESGMDVRESLAEYAHEAWAGWMRHLFSKSTRNDDGTLTIPAWAADRWQRQMTTRYADLPAAAQDSDRAEADRILGITPGRRRRRKVKRVVSMKPLVGRCNYDLNGYSHRQFWRLVRDLTSCGWTVTIQAQEDRRPWEKQTSRMRSGATSRTQDSISSTRRRRA